MFDLIKRVVLSWQVIVITGGLLVYFTLVSYVTRPSRPKLPKEKPVKPEKVAEAEVSGQADEDLGLEEESSS